MKKKNNDKSVVPSHIADERLIAFLDGEVEHDSSREMKSHLESCWDCRRRLGAVERSIENFLQMRQARLLPPELPPSGPALDMFRTRLAVHREHSPSHAPAPPNYAGAPTITGIFIGIFDEFRGLVDMIKASPGYTEAIGEDLMIVGATITPPPIDQMAPDLKVTTSQPYIVHLTGSMQGMDVMRVEYSRKGTAVWVTAAYLTTLPAEFTIAPNTPGAPEMGNIRARFTKKNVEVGNLSPEYPITVS